jgi:hypothetical protein
MLDGVSTALSTLIEYPPPDWSPITTMSAMCRLKSIVGNRGIGDIHEYRSDQASYHALAVLIR